MGNGQNSVLGMNMVLLVFFIALMYFMLIRPQRKRDKETKQMRDSLKRGDKIVTIGGIVGTIIKVGEDTVILETGKDRVRLEMLKTSVGNVINGSAGMTDSKTKPAKDEKTEEESEDAPVRRNKKVTPKKLTAKKAEEAKEEVKEAVEEVKEEAEKTVENPFEK